ncbi:MAG TPA: PD-(D/E)XK nuclease family protein, partial [Longimicrobiales bacterium]|nr:PD-(D/E)XK nuclease family protein [Longimicrobiales bacterium]
MTFSGAMAVLRDHLKIRVPASRQDQPAPWEASGGHLHLSDLEHGGLTGRSVTFVVGLEARQGGEPLQDPLLLDRDRRALAPGELPTARDRLRWRRFRLEALLARLRGRVTLSYTAWDAPQARVLAPDSLVLQVHRLRTGRPEADYEALQHALGPPVTRLPEGRGELDASDVWLEGLSRDGRLLEGRALVHEGFPALGAGALAEAARADDRATAHDGLVEPRPERLDPRLNPELVLSAGRLEDLGTCPKRYFFRQVLGLRPPEDPEREPDRWLDPLERGRLLHRVFEETLRRARREGEAIDGPVLEGLALEVLEEQLQRFRREVPAPGEGVVMGEARSLRGDVRAFAEMVREEGAPWVRLELPFGLDGAPPGILNLSDGEVRLRGKVDRVDEVDGALRIVDYKTGSTWAFKKENRVFHGGRRLQHLVYSRVVEGLLDRPVGGAEYHFPTPRGRNERYRFSRGVLEDGPGLVENLLDAVARGRFLPTEEPRDCGLCDYRSICRVTETPWGSVESPPAEWALRSLDRLEEYAELRRAR